MIRRGDSLSTHHHIFTPKRIAFESVEAAHEVTLTTVTGARLRRERPFLPNVCHIFVSKSTVANLHGPSNMRVAKGVVR
jgi:hypothetical protein